MEILSSANAFEFFGAAHIIVMGITVLLSLFLPMIARLFRSTRTTSVIGFSIAMFLITAELFHYGYIVYRDGLEVLIDKHLPLHVCGLSIYLISLVLITRKQVIFEIAYFWGLAGATQALITPALQKGFPSYDFFNFFLNHCGIIIAVMFATLGMKMRPRAKGLWIAYTATWGIMFVVAGFNYLLDTNYMYLCRPPAGNSPFYFLPWPWYILFQAVIGWVLFFLLWLPHRRSGSR